MMRIKNLVIVPIFPVGDNIFLNFILKHKEIFGHSSRFGRPSSLGTVGIKCVLILNILILRQPCCTLLKTRLACREDVAGELHCVNDKMVCKHNQERPRYTAYLPCKIALQSTRQKK